MLQSLIDWRLGRKLSQEAAAGILGVERTTYNKIETGNRRLLAADLGRFRAAGMPDDVALRVAQEAAEIPEPDPVLTPRDEAQSLADEVRTPDAA